MQGCHTRLYVMFVFSYFPQKPLNATRGKFSEQFLLQSAEPHNNNFDKNKREHISHCDGLPISRKFQVCKLVFILY